jgi:lipopolysaccharide export LptBFGC system permease protein LptF
MRIFTRYILREVISYAILGGVLFTFVLFMRDLAKILDLLVRDSASFTDAVRIFADMLPNTLTVTIPTAVLAGILLGLSRLAADSEVTAMRACGIGALTFVRIVSILSFAALGIGLINALYFAPHGASDLLKLEDELKSSQASVAVQPRVFYEDFKNYVLYVQDVRPTASASWRHVFLADLTQPANPNVTTADSAIVASPDSADSQTLRLHLLNGGQHQISPTDPNQYDITHFDSTDVPLQHSILLSLCLPRPDAYRRAARALLQARRQEHRLRSDSAARLRLLPGERLRHRLREVGQVIAIPWRVVGKYHLCDIWDRAVAATRRRRRAD